jgi:hypothetical protein
MAITNVLKGKLIFLSVSILILSVTFLPILSTVANAKDSADVKKLVLLHTSDEHSFNLGVGPESEDYPTPTVPGSIVYRYPSASSAAGLYAAGI